MVLETLRRLRPFKPFQELEYLGFGGFEFVDFQLMRRELGIIRMISIETRGNRARYEFNCPYAEITMKFGRATDFLSELNWEPMRIIWLDYTSRLTAEVLDDVRDIVDNAVAGSFLLVSIDARPPPDGERRAQFEKDLGGVAPVPGGYAEADLARWGYANAEYRVLVRRLEQRFARRSDKATFLQLLHFNYFDTREMLTVGGLFLHPSAQAVLEQCRFGDLDFIRNGDVALELRVPDLTRKEVAHINHQLPVPHGGALESPGIDPEQLARYAELYRWYPAVA